MLTSWTGSIPTRQSQRQAWEVPEHLLSRATGYLALGETTTCPHCKSTLTALAAPLVVQGKGDGFATYVNHATYCMDCPVVVVDGNRLKATVGAETKVQLIGILMAGVSDKRNDTTICPFDEVCAL